MEQKRIIYDPLPTGAEFTDKFGRSKKGEQIIFYICIRKNSNDKPKGIGTGFYIGYDGLFLSAKHIFDTTEDYEFRSYESHNEDCNTYGIVFVPENRTFRKIPIAYIRGHETSDIVVGKLMGIDYKSTGKRIPNDKFYAVKKKKSFKPGRAVSSFFFPKELEISEDENTINAPMGHWELGHILDYFPGGFLFLKDACYETNLKIVGGSSGGPVFVMIEKRGYVFAVNSLGGEGELRDRTYITPITQALDLRIRTMKDDDPQLTEDISLERILEMEGNLLFKKRIK